MAPITTNTPITMTTLSITSLSSSIYGASTITFNDDIGACTTVDINYSTLTKVDSWCP